MDKKLAKLQRRTQESIHTLIRELHYPSLRPVFNLCFIGQRLAAQKGDADDIAGAMRAQVKAQNADENEDDDD
jgi:coiled-coil domain-containing protein 12